MNSEHQPSEKADGIYIDQLPVHFSTVLLKKALSLPVRELEQETKGRWVAFADEDAESFDVQITIEKKKIIAHYCDCKESNDQFCKHKIAVLLKLAQQATGETKSAGKTSKTKPDPVTQLLDQVEYDDLKHWIKEKLLQNKDLGISFLNRFRVKPDEYSAEEIQLITDKAVRSIVKNKRRLDQSELKKVILLLKDVHEPVMAFYLRNISDSDKVSILAKLLQTIEFWNNAFKIKSTKIPAYKAEILAKTIQPLYDIEKDEAWQSVISAYFRQGFDIQNQARTDWLIFLSDLIKLETRKNRVDFILETFKRKYIDSGKKEGSTVSESLTELIFKAYQNADRVKDCITWIKPIPGVYF